MTDAENLLRELGIGRPEEIDLEAIATSQGLKVKHRELQGCEARIVGFGSNGIISVDRRSTPGRIRFSTAHELGHWHRHRGRSLTCRSDDIGNPRRSVTDPERVADSYAADLLMPGYIFDKQALAHGYVSTDAVFELAAQFRTSLTATAIRLVERGPEYAFLISNGPHGRKWFRRHKAIEEKWFPKASLDPDSFAYDLMKEGGSSTERELIDAEAWFDRDDAGEYEVWEESFRISGDEILTLVVVKHEEMLG